jgi:hypothetical protein
MGRQPDWLRLSEPDRIGPDGEKLSWEVRNKSFLTKKIKEVQARLKKQEPEKTKALIKLEKKLKSWIAQRSLAQILDWFDCIETTKVQTAMGSYRWSTESVARDRLFLKYLGMAVR